MTIEAVDELGAVDYLVVAFQAGARSDRQGRRPEIRSRAGAAPIEHHP